MIDVGWSPGSAGFGGTILGNSAFEAVNPVDGNPANGAASVAIVGSYSGAQHEAEVTLKAADIGGGGGMVFDMYQLFGNANHAGQALIGDTSEAHWCQMWQINGDGTGALIGFFSATPVAQKAAIAAPSGGTTVDTQARAAIVSILNALSAAAGGYGLTA